MLPLSTKDGSHPKTDTSRSRRNRSPSRRHIHGRNHGIHGGIHLMASAMPAAAVMHLD